MNFESGFDFPLGHTIVVFEGTDESGNIGTCEFRVTVEGVNHCLLKLIADLPLLDEEAPIIITGGGNNGGVDSGVGGGKSKVMYPRRKLTLFKLLLALNVHLETAHLMSSLKRPLVQNSRLALPTGRSPQFATMAAV